MNPDCSHKTFSEKHPFVTAKSKKTNRLIQNILYASSQLSSLNASKLLMNNPVPVSLLSGDRKPQIRFLGNHHSGSGNLYHKSFRM